jgi:isopenicillin N synthase-like dioxygenase
MNGIPVVDVAPLVADDGTMVTEVGTRSHAAAHALDAAFRTHGFATVIGHGIDPSLLPRMEEAARAFFAQPDERKAEVAMARGGRAWRGWFPVGGELTSGVADEKEGLYVGIDLPPPDPRVAAGLPLHGPNLWPAEPADLRPVVDAWMAAATSVGHALLRGLGVGLGVGPTWFVEHLTADPVVLFRAFHYPPVPPGVDGWGVAEHTDYGLLTLLAQDALGGLEVRGPDGDWIDVPARPDALVCNIGDMLDRLTGGRYRSTPHRVRPTDAPQGRLSFPLFLDPSWDAVVEPLPLEGPAPDDDAATRWDGTSLQHLSGTYGDYLTAKVAKVFPALADDTLG